MYHADAADGLLSLAVPEPAARAALFELEANARETAIYGPGAWALELEITERLRAQRPPRPGPIMGWDVLAVDFADLHSWLCNGLGERLAADAAALPESNGLFATLARAEAIADAANALIGRNNGEYSSWFPVALIHCARAVRGSDEASEG